MTEPKTHDLAAAILTSIKRAPRTFFLLAKEFREQAKPLCVPGRFGPNDINPDALVGRVLQDLRKAGHIHYSEHAWRFLK